MNLKTKLRAQTLLFMSLIGLMLVYACRKELHSSEDSLSKAANSVLLKEAKTYYTALKKREGSTLEVTNLGGRQLESQLKNFPKENKKYALFNKSIQGETRRSKFVEVSIVYDQRISTLRTPKDAGLSEADRKLMFRNSFDRLVIYKSKSSGKIKHMFLTYVPTISYIKKKGAKIKMIDISNLWDFTGYIEFKNWDGSATHVTEYLEGKKVKSYKLKNRSSRRSTTQQESKGAVIQQIWCYPTMIEVWGEMCTGAGGEEGTDYMNCVPYLIGMEWGEYCEDDGLSGDPCVDFGICDGEDDPCILYGVCEPCTGGCDEEEPVEPDPCAKVSGQTNSEGYKGKVTDLKAKTGLSHETGYEEKKAGNYNPLVNAGNDALVANPEDDTKGFIHTHIDDYITTSDDGTETVHRPIKMFSPADVNVLMALVDKNRNSGNFSDYYVSLITSSGHYMLKFTGTVNDITTGWDGAVWSERYALFMQNYVNVEKGFLKFLKQEMGVNGVKLFQVRNNGNIRDLELSPSGNSVQKTDC